MSAASGESAMFEKLKALLVGDVAERLESVEVKAEALHDATQRLDAIEAATKRVDAFIGAPSRLETATAEILAGALRKAEVAGHGELARSLAPLVIAAIRTEIKNSKDMMVEALYPITGRLVTAAVANAFRNLVEELNGRIDAMVSADVWRLRLRALATGRTMAEVALADADAGSLKRALLLERGSGRALAAWPERSPASGKAELTSGLIAAVTEFAAQAYADRGGELRMLDLGASKVFLRASARIIVAAEFAGGLSPARERRLNDAFLQIVEAHEKDEHTLNASALAQILGESLKPERKPGDKTPLLLVGGALAALVIWAASGPITRALRERRIDAAFAVALAEHKSLADFPLRLDVDHKAQSVTLRGISPNESEAQSVLDAVAPDAYPYSVARDVIVLTPLAQSARADTRIASLDAALAQTRGELAELRAQNNTAAMRLRRFTEHSAIFFTTLDNLADPVAAGVALDALAQLLEATGEGLRVVGYADEVGTQGLNHSVSRQRAEKVVAMLVERGVAREKLSIAARSTFAPIADASLGGVAMRNRRVVFERLYDGELDAR
jgi:outer membrane protein OmpA-like peptidoglycan-associated protein